MSLFKESTQFSARLMLAFFGDEATLTMGTGPDHSIYDLYVDGVFWQAIDGYVAVASTRDIIISTGIDGRKLATDGLHIIEIRNRAERHKLSTGYKVRFKQVLIVGKAYTAQTISYSYDKLSRLREARYAPGVNAAAVDADLLRRYQYAFDLAGNRSQQSVAVNGAAPTVTNYTYNAGNQLTSDGANSYTYDNNGNLTSYTWDRANRIIGGGGATYKYDGLGNRLSQTVSSIVTNYLNDLQPGLAVVLRATQGANTDRYVYSPRGIHGQETNGQWYWSMQDGLGSVREMSNNAVASVNVGSYDPYGVPFGSISGVSQMHGFTGEATNIQQDVFLRARHYSPARGIFPSLDPFEGVVQHPMSLNGYGWVEGNVPNAVDPSGMLYERPDKWARCKVPSYSSQIQLCPDPNNPFCPAMPEITWPSLCDILPFLCPTVGASPEASTGSIAIPIPEDCRRESCDSYAMKLLRALALLGATELTRRISNFTLFVDGGRVPPNGGVHSDLGAIFVRVQNPRLLLTL